MAGVKGKEWKKINAFWKSKSMNKWKELFDLKLKLGWVCCLLHGEEVAFLDYIYIYIHILFNAAKVIKSANKIKAPNQAHANHIFI